MAFAVNIKDGRQAWPSNKVRPQLQLKKTKVTLYVHISKWRLMCHLLLARGSMALAVDAMHGPGPSNKRRTQLQPKKTKVRPY